MSEPTAADLLWAPASGTATRRGPRPRVTLAELVATGIRLADAEGLDAASMQRVADEVGVTKMALYRYVPNRDALIALMVDTAMGPVSAPKRADDPDASPASWQPRLRAWAHAVHDVFAAHRWLLTAAVGARVFGPNELSWTEAGLGVLEELPLTAGERLDTLTLVSAHVRGLVQQETQPDLEAQLAETLGAVLTANADAYPLAAAAFADAATDTAQDAALEYGLDRIIAGIAALVAARG
ncbi:TetR/AcrR family transcriptional regulator [Agromyces intestinalis]|uniref:TetR/AcrR family transcriptional regulator n=1 Tax=Agromyces intestinalis TaxID=2592652 RepID=A0A5C1YDQ8_9MICO|nr:TetR/AcrR family transcriptional regulator [Agromyces intestinalis]QEO14243.1 TetR/AcrR family transcriptional regulator [Agromyces intestinalis]